MAHSSKYHPSLDGLRAVCILFTIANHTPGNPGINGTIGVDIFFGLSGYLITMLLIREQEETGRICLLCFYIRRFFRIVPLYYLAILLYLPSVYSAYFLVGNSEGVSDYFAALPYLITFNSEWRPDEAGALFGHAWTLGIEEKFYVLWPALFLLMGSGRRSLWLLPVMPLFFLMGDMNGRGYVGILTGAVAASLIETRSVRPVVDAPAHIWFAAMVVGYVIATAFDNTSLNILISIPASLFIAHLIHRPHDIYGRILSAKPLAWLGTLTYALYLIHRLAGHVFEELFAHLDLQPGFLVYFVLTYGSSVIVAWFLRKTLEQPMIEIGRQLSQAYSRRTRERAQIQATQSIQVAPEKNIGTSK